MAFNESSELLMQCTKLVEEEVSKCNLLHGKSFWALFPGWLQQNDLVIRATAILAATAVIAILLHYLFKPMNWKRDLSDVGYNHLDDEICGRSRGKRKRELVQKIRRLRNAGEKVPPPFPNGWFSLLESSQLKNKEVKNVDCLGENFVVFRAEDGTAHVLDAYCPHLGANMGIGGVVHGNCIECPFHQWQFRGDDGQCTNVPYSVNGSVPKVKVKKWQSCEVDGAIFVWHHVDNEEPWELPSEENIRNGNWVYSGRNDFLVNCHIQEISENGADAAHLNAIHNPNLFGGSDLRFCRGFWTAVGFHSWVANWQRCPEPERAHIATLDLNHSIQLFHKYKLFSMDVQANQIGPGYVQLYLNMGILGTMIILQSVTPIEPLVQRVVHRIYCRPSLALLAKFSLWGETIMFERDVMVWNHKKYIDSPYYLKEDKSIKKYRAWYSQFYSNQSKEFRYAQESLDW